MSAPDAEARPGWGRFLPLILFLALAGLMGAYLLAAQFLGYQRDTLPSALIGQPAPTAELAPLRGDGLGLTAEMLTAPGVKVVNVWASWCGPCRVEHPHLMTLAAQGVTVLGLNHRDQPGAALAFLQELGDPYAAVGVDPTGRASVDWGVYGVPETFIVNSDGRIVDKHVGPIQNDDLQRVILPAIAAAR